MGFDLEEAVVDPSRVFGDPDDILKAPGLSPKQKHAILERWHELERERPGTADVTTADGRPCILLRIARSLAALEGMGGNGSAVSAGSRRG